MRNRSQRGPALPFLLSALALLAAPLCAGPVPGVETFDKRPVEFPVPEHLDVWSIGEDEYLVTFRWTPEEGVKDPSVAGGFNHWSRTDLPMSDEDGDGTYEVTARMPGGEWQYKFTAAPDQWITDPLNPNGVSDGHEGQNSVLKLGILALLEGHEAKRGDGKIEARALAHRPGERTFYDVWGPEDVTIRLRTLRNDVATATLITERRNGETGSRQMRLAGADELFDYYETDLSVREGERDAPLVGYHFRVMDNPSSTADDAKPVTYPQSGQAFPLVLNPKRIVRTPNWAKDAIWYQIMVDRFRDGDEDNNPEHLLESSTNRPDATHPWTSDWFAMQPYEGEDGQTFWEWSVFHRLYGGDFEGVIEKLDYLEDLGVNAIYFNPVFESHNSHKYNARSYLHVDDGYGVAGEFDKAMAREDELDPSTWVFNESDKKLLELIEEAHKRDMKVILDGVFNHLGDDAVSFLDVKEKGQASRFADWYRIDSWEPFSYTGWAGFAGLPEFEDDAVKGLKSDSVREHIYAVTRRWMDPNGDGDPSDGIDGWRLDVPGNVPMPFWYEWSALVKKINPDAYIVGEIWGPAEEWLDGRSFDAVMNYPFAEAAFDFFAHNEDKITATEFDLRLGRHRMRYPRQVNFVLQNLHDSHDTDRWASMIVNPDRDYDQQNRIQDGADKYDAKRPTEEVYRRLRLMALFQATYVGAPMIWYGTEVGMYGADDPMTRLPMWWDDLEPYENPDYRVDKELREYFRDLFHLRQEEGVLRRGDFETVLTDDEKDLYGFLRSLPDEDEGIAVVLNNSGETQTVRVPEGNPGTRWSGWTEIEPIFGEGELQVLEKGQGAELTLPPVSGVVLRVKLEPMKAN